jgi:hypothetical protein
MAMPLVGRIDPRRLPLIGLVVLAIGNACRYSAAGPHYGGGSDADQNSRHQQQRKTFGGYRVAGAADASTRVLIGDSVVDDVAGLLGVGLSGVMGAVLTVAVRTYCRRSRRLWRWWC